jgi:hypothetical protein
MATLAGTPFRIQRLDTYRPKLVLNGPGMVVYHLDASGTEISAYVPDSIQGAVLVFLCLDSTNTVTIRAKNSAWIDGSAIRTITMTEGQALILTAVNNTWQTLTFDITTT